MKNNLALWTLWLVLAVRLFSGPLENLKPGEWYEVPNSHLRTVVPSPTPPGNPVAIMNAWSGGAYDTQRDRLIVWGGGHGDYAGNEIYAFDINTLQWSRIWGPTPNIPAGVLSGTCSETYSDGNPCARHTYDGLEYLPVEDGFWIHGGSLSCGSGGAGSDTRVFDFLSMTWALKAKPNVSSYAELDMVSAFDPVTGHVFYSDKTWPFLEYNPAANTWANRGDNINYGYGYGVAEIDPKHRQFIFLGTGGSLGDYVLQYTLTPSGTIAQQKITTTGATEIIGMSPGLAYDPASEKLVAWGKNQYVYTLDAATRVWTKVSPASTNTVVPTGSDHGTYGRWRYIPSKNLFVGVTSIDGNVYFYKLTSGAGTSVERAVPGKLRSPALAASPNPARAGSTVVFERGSGGAGAVKIYDLRGRMVRKLSGSVWDGRDFSGRKLNAGIYSAIAEENGRRVSASFTLLK